MVGCHVIETVSVWWGMNGPPPHVIVVGAGYAGLLAANRLAARGRRVILISPEDTIVDRIRLHEYVAGVRAEPVRPLTLRRGVQFVRATVAHVAAGDVKLTDGRILTATHILLTTGSTNRSDSTGLIARRSLATLAAARHTRLALTSLPPGARVSVVGAGLTGLETATEIAEARPHLRVRVVSHGPIGAFLPDPGRHHLERTPERLGIDTASTPEGLVLDCTGFTTPVRDRTDHQQGDHRCSPWHHHGRQPRPRVWVVTEADRRRGSA